MTNEYEESYYDMFLRLGYPKIIPEGIWWWLTFKDNLYNRKFDTPQIKEKYLTNCISRDKYFLQPIFNKLQNSKLNLGDFYFLMNLLKIKPTSTEINQIPASIIGLFTFIEYFFCLSFLENSFKDDLDKISIVNQLTKYYLDELNVDLSLICMLDKLSDGIILHYEVLFLNLSRYFYNTYLETKDENSLQLSLVLLGNTICKKNIHHYESCTPEGIEKIILNLKDMWYVNEKESTSFISLHVDHISKLPIKENVKRHYFSMLLDNDLMEGVKEKIKLQLISDLIEELEK